MASSLSRQSVPMVSDHLSMNVWEGAVGLDWLSVEVITIWDGIEDMLACLLGCWLEACL